MRSALLIAVTATFCAIFCAQAGAHLVSHPPKNASRAQIHASQLKNLAHARYVCRHGAHHHKFWACKAVVWLSDKAAETAAPKPVPETDWAAVQIHYATIIGAASHAQGGDPWPNCPDPFDGRGSWTDTVNCENSGNWYDSPGYFRCGLQFDPGWEAKYGVRFCP